MTQENKNLSLKDLSARLPYGVVMNTPNGDGHLCSINQTIFGNEYGINISATRRDYFNDEKLNFKPYLRPMSSMTEEEKEEFESIWNNGFGKALDAQISNCDDNAVRNLEIIASSNAIDWLNKKMFDYRGLIDRGLALEAPEGMYELKEK